VSLHDVSPQTFAACREIVAQLEALGVAAISLLVIPDHHGRGRVQQDAALCSWLRELSERGHEVVTHGYLHRRARRTGEKALAKLTTRIYTADEGEFYDLDFASARELVARGNAELRELGLNPRGFIAPAWLLSSEAESALGDLGVEYTTRLGTVTDLQRGKIWKSQSLVWSVRAAWRRATSLLWNAWLFARLRERPLLRISVHPVDLAHPRIWRQIRALVCEALQTRDAVTYLQWIQERRALRGADRPADLAG
jgi:hypothetical protein